MKSSFSVLCGLVASSILLGAGIAAPCMTIHPSYGELSPIVATLFPRLEDPVQYSIVQSVETLFAGGHYLVSTIIVVFSVLFPVVKLGVLWVARLEVIPGGEPCQRVKLIEKIGKFSMLDVFVLALIVVAVKGLPGGTAVRLEWGVYAFGLSILIALVLPGMILKVHRDTP